MKRILVFACILAMSALPAMVSAQVLPASGGFPGVGTLGSLFGSTGTYGQTTAGLVAPPTFYVGYSGQGQGASFGVGFDTTIGNVNGLKHTYDLSALALGASGSLRFSDRISVIASGWWMVPTAGARSIEPFDLVGVSAHRSWSTDTNWWWVDALAAYNLGGGVAFLGGFRYDRFETKFKNPHLVANIPDEANVKSNGYIPLLGLLYSTGSSANMITAYAVGFPTLLGRAEYHETVTGARVNAAGDYNNGFFFETGLDYKRRVMGDADLGAFFRYNATRGNFSGSIEVNPGLGTSSFRGGLTRTSISVGGLLNLPFRLPFM